MPIVRTYACPNCNHFLRVTLSADQVDAPPPECPRCAAWDMQQEFRAPAIVGSSSSRAHAIAEDIAAKDYNVADMNGGRHEGEPTKVRYRDQPTVAQASSWGQASETLQAAISAGRQNRLRYGSGLDVLHSALKDGSQPDLIELSKQRSIRVF